MSNRNRKKVKVAPVQQQTQGIEPENIRMLQQMQAMQKEEKMLEQEAQNKMHDAELSPYRNNGVETPEQIEIIGEKEVKKATETLKKYKECKENLEQRIIENEEWFKMQHWELLRKKKDKESVEPASAWLFNTIINKHADMMDNYPEALILPRERSDETTAKALSSIVPVVLEQNDYEQVYSDCAWYKLKAGVSLQGVFWDNSKLNGLGDITIKKCDVINLFWESGITDIQESPNVFYVTIVSNEELKKSYPNLKNLGNFPELETKKYMYDDKIDTTGKSVVVDWYYKEKLYGHDANGIPQVKTILHYCKFCNGQVLFASENDPNMRETGFYKHGLYPFVVDNMFPEEGMLCGFGYIDIMKDCQAYIDKMQQAILDNALINARSRSIVNDNAGINADEYADPSKTLIHATGNLGENAFRQIETRPMSGIYMTVLNNKIQEIKDTSGNTAASQGQASSVTSASGIASLQEAAGKLARDANKSTYRAFRKVVLLVIELMREFYTEERCFRIIGDDGKQDFIDFDNRGMVPQIQPPAFGIDLGSRTPVFDADIRAAKQSAYSREAQNNMALQFYSAGFFAPNNADASIACLNMMEFDGKEQVIEQVRQNQTLLKMVMQLQQQMMQMGAVIDAQNGTDLAEQMAGQAQQLTGQQAQSAKGSSKGTSRKSSKGSLTKQAATAARNATAPQ